MPSEAQAPPLSDEVALILQRAYPGEVEKDELLDQSGLNDTELREVLDYLEEDDQLDTEAEHYRWLDPNGERSDAAAPPADDEEASPETTENGARGPSTGKLLARTHLTVVATFSRAAGQSDDAIARKAQVVSDEVRSAIGTQLPDLDCDVRVERVEAWDSPRVIYPPGDDADA